MVRIRCEEVKINVKWENDQRSEIESEVKEGISGKQKLVAEEVNKTGSEDRNKIQSDLRPKYRAKSRNWDSYRIGVYGLIPKWREKSFHPRREHTIIRIKTEYFAYFIAKVFFLKIMRIEVVSWFQGQRKGNFQTHVKMLIFMDFKFYTIIIWGPRLFPFHMYTGFICKLKYTGQYKLSILAQYSSFQYTSLLFDLCRAFEPSYYIRL